MAASAQINQTAATTVTQLDIKTTSIRLRMWEYQVAPSAGKECSKTTLVILTICLCRGTHLREDTQPLTPQHTLKMINTTEMEWWCRHYNKERKAQMLAHLALTYEWATSDYDYTVEGIMM